MPEQAVSGGALVELAHRFPAKWVQERAIVQSAEGLRNSETLKSRVLQNFNFYMHHNTDCPVLTCA
jgi:hypothetical protein